jgi:simple sugar transport system permease protein
VLSDGFDATYAFDGIAVALLARNNPLFCIPAALLFGALEQGGSAMEAQIGLSSTIVIMTEGVIIVLVAMTTPYAKTLRMRRIDARAPSTATLVGEAPVLTIATGESE